MRYDEESADPTGPDVPYAAEQVKGRAELLPEEQVAGSDNPGAQAEAILEDSLERTVVRTEEQGAHLERRRSEETA